MSVYAAALDRAPSLLQLVVENIGLAPAYEIRFKVNEPFKCLDRTNLQDFKFIQHGLRFLSPDRRKTVLFANLMKQDSGTRLPAPVIAVSYRNAAGDAMHEGFIVDLQDFSDWGQFETSVDRVADSLGQIQKDLHQLIIGFSTLKVRIENPPHSMNSTNVPE